MLAERGVLARSLVRIISNFSLYSNGQREGGLCDEGLPRREADRVGKRVKLTRRVIAHAHQGSAPDN